MKAAVWTRYDSHYLSDRLLTKRTKAAGEASRQRRDNLAFLLELLEAGTIKPVIDRCYPLAQAAAAHRYVETGQKRGHVVLTVVADASCVPVPRHPAVPIPNP